MDNKKLLIKVALEEDLMEYGDLTSSAIFDTEEEATFNLFAKEQGIACGCRLFSEVMKTVDSNIDIEFYIDDGATIYRGDKIAKVKGNIVNILTAERTALNFLAHLSGISTQTAKFTERTKDTKTIILDTRKTTPGYRKLEKYAVLCGGAKNHRHGLYDMVMIKDNHIDSAGSITKAVEKVRNRWDNNHPIEVEVRNFDELEEAIQCKVDRIMLDNMSKAQIQEAVEYTNGRVPLEASGNMTLNKISQVAKTGVDYISVGALTHSVKSFDFSLRKENHTQDKIKALIEELRDDIVILGHHYQRPEIIKNCDFTGDSYGLAVEGMKQKAKYIIFCGVRFMAEGAAILATNKQQIVLPEHRAGCPMADMMTGEKAEKILLRIQQDIGQIPAPVVYMNSYADSKMVCGKYNGSVCTSSNAEKILNYYFDKNKPVFFFPDQHLGMNTANDMNLKTSEIALVKPNMSIKYNGNKEDVKIFLFDGYCHVHQDFTTENIRSFREEYPNGTVIVHPEVHKDVLQKADLFGSTEKIYNTVVDAPLGTIWGIGTEINFVQRLAESCPDKTVLPILSSLCHNMAKITEDKLLNTLSNLKAHIKENIPLENEITVNDTHRELSKKALQQMIKIVES